MNTDQASCDLGCLGRWHHMDVYDTSWPFSPLSRIDLHLIGEGLEDSRLRFDKHASSASTDLYGSYSQYRAFKDREMFRTPSCPDLSIKDAFNELQLSMTKNNPFAYMQQADLTSAADGMMIMVQMMVAAQKYSVLENGWHLLARLHILLREFDRAKVNDELWLAKSDNLGFSNYTRVEANSLSNNDFLLIALSYSTSLDYRELFQMWGLETTQKAKYQVGRFNFTVIDKKVYVYQPGEYCKGFDQLISVSVGRWTAA